MDLPVVYLLFNGPGSNKAIDKAIVFLPVSENTTHGLDELRECVNDNSENKITCNQLLNKRISVILITLNFGNPLIASALFPHKPVHRGMDSMRCRR